MKYKSVNELELNPRQLQDVFEVLSTLSLDFVSKLSTQPAVTSKVPSKEFVALPDDSLGLGTSIRKAFEVLQESGINTASSKFMGYIPGGGIEPAAFGDFVAAFINSYSGLYLASPAAVEIEDEITQWFCDIFNLGKHSWGSLTSGWGK